MNKCSECGTAFISSMHRHKDADEASRIVKAEKLAKARRQRAENRQKAVEWRRTHRDKIKVLKKNQQKRRNAIRQQVAKGQRAKSKAAYREKIKTYIARQIKLGWTLCKATCKECGEEFEYVKARPDSPSKTFCSPACQNRWRWIHVDKPKHQRKMRLAAASKNCEISANPYERGLNPRNNVDRIFIYGF